MIRMDKYRYEVRQRGGKVLSCFDSFRKLEVMDIYWHHTHTAYRVYAVLDDPPGTPPDRRVRVIYVDPNYKTTHKPPKIKTRG